MPFSLAEEARPPLLWTRCWGPLCTSLLSSRPPSSPPTGLDILPQSQVCHTWSVPDEVALGCGHQGMPARLHRVQDGRHGVASSAFVQPPVPAACPQPPVPSRLSPAACPQPPVPASCPHLPDKQQACRSFQPRAWPLAPASLPRSAPCVLSPAEAWPFGLGHPRDAPNHPHPVPGQAVQPSQHRPR